jgi:predicted TIM-barrel fold metal-dependent hydrolase
MNNSPSPPRISRRAALAGTGSAAASLLLAGTPAAAAAPRAGRCDDLAALIARTPFIDTHEHLVEEERRTGWTKPTPHLPCDDWALLFTHYLNSDLLVAGMPARDYAAFTAPDTSTTRKWALLEPWWPAVKHTGYARAVRIALERLYGVSELNAKTVHRVAEGYRRTVRRGFYATVLREHAGIESCQVNSLEAPFMESRQPRLLMQDLSILAFGVGAANWQRFTDADGSRATDLAGWHRVIDHWFARYAPYAVAVKTQVAYQRRLDFEDVPAERAAEPFRRLVAGEPVSDAERKAVDDHLFWYCVRKATAAGLPVKVHTGYYAGQNSMPLGRVVQNPADFAEVLRRAPDTTFVLMHMGYPCQEQILALAKHYANAVVDLCWAWIISPTATERFVRDFLVTAPANKLLTFGGDYIPVEPVVGHAALARQGLHRALERLTGDHWLTRAEALELVPMLMHGNARRIFRLEAKERALRNAPWAG